MPALGALALSTQANTAATWQALKAPGSIVLFRHALAPGGGDPAGFVAGDCSTQRNLGEEGRQQAKRLGDTLRHNGVNVTAVWHSAWCRTRDTAQLAFPHLAAPLLRAEPAFNSFFGNPSDEPAQTAAARQLLLGWRGPGTLIVVTHQVNITALTGIVPQSGEGVVLQLEGTQLVTKGRVLSTYTTD
jgi:phosphohistidine phosphatase SixA